MDSDGFGVRGGAGVCWPRPGPPLLLVLLGSQVCEALIPTSPEAIAFWEGG